MRLRWYFILLILVSLLLLTTVGWGKITSKYVNAPKVNVRSAPSKNASIITTLSLNTKVKCIKESKGWTKVNISPLSKQGWIFSVLLSDKPVNASSLGSLGGGYKNAKWGMPPSQVKKVLSGKITSSGAHYIRYDMGERKKLTCRFYKNQLYYVLYEPGLPPDDMKGVKAVVSVLERKYGQYVPCKFSDSYVSGYGIPHLVWIWDDGITRIEVVMEKPTRFFPCPSSTLDVRYTCKRIETIKEREEKQEKERREKQELKQKMKEVEEGL